MCPEHIQRARGWRKAGSVRPTTPEPSGHRESRWRGAELDSLIARVSTVDPYYVPLLRAARDCVVTLFQPMRGARLNPRKLERMCGRTILLIDDCEPCSTGPDGWTGIKAVRGWAYRAWVQPTGATADHAAEAVQLASECVRLLIIRTTDEQMPAWARWCGSEAGPPETWRITHGSAVLQ